MSSRKQLSTRLNQMTEHTYTLIRGAFRLAWTMALCALTLAITRPRIAGFDACTIAAELIGLSALTMLLAAVASVAVEELTMEK